ncbi:MAG: caspase family protein, partial [bacterium]
MYLLEVISPNRGSHYTKYLCESFKENGARKELLEIVRDVNRKLAERHQGY